MDKINFSKGMALLLETYPDRFGEFNEGTYSVWYELLRDIPDQDWGKAVLYICRNHKRPPVPGDIREVVRYGNGARTAEEAWGLVLEQVTRCGRDQNPSFEEEAITETVKAMGWRNICAVGIGELSVFRAHFYRTYDAVSRRLHVFNEYQAIEAGPLMDMLPERRLKLITNNQEGP